MAGNTWIPFSTKLEANSMHRELSSAILSYLDAVMFPYVLFLVAVSESSTEPTSSIPLVEDSVTSAPDIPSTASEGKTCAENL